MAYRNGLTMGVYDEIEFPWLKEAKDFIRKSIESGKIILGICLGARVFKNEYREISWFPIWKNWKS